MHMYHVFKCIGWLLIYRYISEVVYFKCTHTRTRTLYREESLFLLLQIYEVYLSYKKWETCFLWSQAFICIYNKCFLTFPSINAEEVHWNNVHKQGWILPYAFTNILKCSLNFFIPLLFFYSFQTDSCHQLLEKEY